MKKWQKVLLILLMCYFSYYVVYEILNLTSLKENIKVNVSLIFYILPIFIYLFVIKWIIKKENNEVSVVSSKIQKLIRINELYDFKIINHNKHIIVEREYSRKSLDRVTASSVIKYHIENNINFLRTDIENAIYNISLLDKYNEEVKKIIDCTSTNESKYNDKKYRRIENRIIKSLIHKREESLISLKLEVYYKSNGGNVNVSKYGKYNFQQLECFYNEWKNGNKYEETKKQERKIMNEDIRYNVLKRDNYTCQICGATAKDGVKLHVDHIIPIARGGKTVMSNLQTLCEKCNMGKSDKMSGDNEDMICPRCGARLVKRSGKYGDFIGCSNYPKCHYIKQ